MLVSVKKFDVEKVEADETVETVDIEDIEDDEIDDDTEDDMWRIIDPLLRSNPDLANMVDELNQLLDPNRITGAWEETRLCELLIEISEPFNGLNRPLTVQEAELMTWIRQIRDDMINNIEIQLSFKESEMNRLIKPDDTWDVWDEQRLVYLFGEINHYHRMFLILLHWTAVEIRLNRRVLDLMRLMDERVIERERQRAARYEDIDERRQRRRERRRQQRRRRRRERQLAERTPLPDSDVDFRPVLRF